MAQSPSPRHRIAPVDVLVDNPQPQVGLFTTWYSKLSDLLDTHGRIVPLGTRLSVRDAGGRTIDERHGRSPRRVSDNGSIAHQRPHVFDIDLLDADIGPKLDVAVLLVGPVAAGSGSPPDAVDPQPAANFRDRVQANGEAQRCVECSDPTTIARQRRLRIEGFVRPSIFGSRRAISS